MNKFIKFFALAVAAIGLTSCLKDENIEVEKYGMINLNANKVVEIPSASKAISLDLVNSTSTLDFITVNLAAEEPAAEDIKVTLSTDKSAAMIAAYNTANGSSVAALPTSLYTLPAGLTVTIPKGSHTASFQLALNPNSLDPATTYGLGLRVAEVDKSGYVISGNFGTALVRISVKNKYDGIYSVEAGSTITRNSATGPDLALSGSTVGVADRPLITLGANTVSIVPLWANNTGIAGIDNTYLTINTTTNLVTAASLGNAILKNTTGTVNKYDPATKTFTLAFDWGIAPNTRVVTFVLKYKKAR